MQSSVAPASQLEFFQSARLAEGSIFPVFNWFPDDLPDLLMSININENDYPDFWHEASFIDVANPAHLYKNISHMPFTRIADH